MKKKDKVLCRGPHKVSGTTMWVEVSGNKKEVSGINIDAAGGNLAKKGVVKASTPLGKRADSQIAGYCKNSKNKIRLPLAKQELIPSQQAALDYINGIPTGEVRTYKQQAQAVSKRCGNNFNPRNAGNANRQNPYPLATPCHRIVPSTGGAGGFMGSTRAKATKLKEALLHHEGVEI